MTPELHGQNVTDIAPDGSGGAYVTTRAGVWYRQADGAMRKLNARASFLDPEAQALCAVPQGLWVATRTGLYFLTKQTLAVKS